MVGSATTRSKLMARIRGRNTAPEKALRAALRDAGLAPRANPRTPYGRPDAGLAGKLCIFVDGCFWHGCPKHYVRPRSRESFWSGKLQANVLRDRQQTLALLEAGWTVLRFWEHEVEEDPARCVHRVLKALAQRRRMPVPWHRVVTAVPVDAAGSVEYRVVIDILGRARPRLVVVRRHTRKWKRRM